VKFSEYVKVTEDMLLDMLVHLLGMLFQTEQAAHTFCLLSDTISNIERI